jgi:hypothetical protein
MPDCCWCAISHCHHVSHHTSCRRYLLEGRRMGIGDDRKTAISPGRGDTTTQAHGMYQATACTPYARGLTGSRMTAPASSPLDAQGSCWHWWPGYTPRWVVEGIWHDALFVLVPPGERYAHKIAYGPMPPLSALLSGLSVLRAIRARGTGIARCRRRRQREAGRCAGMGIRRDGKTAPGNLFETLRRSAARAYPRHLHGRHHRERASAGTPGER